MGDLATLDLRRSFGAVALCRDAVLVEGPDALDFLQGQLSQDVATLALGDSAPSLLLQPTGKVDAWLRVTRLSEDRFALDVDAGWGDAVMARLRRFLLRTKATLAREQWSGVALRGPGANEVAVTAEHRLPAAWPGVDAVDALGPSGGTAEVPPTAAVALEALRIAAGVPAMGAEVTDATIPAELGQWLIDASASFTKGCYTGQELVARIDSRGGRVPHPVRGLRIDGPVPALGSTVRLDGQEVGHLTSAAPSPAQGAIALAVLARTVEPGAAVSVTGPDGEQAAVVTQLPMG
jgi:folate-binding protein YgfZ